MQDPLTTFRPCRGRLTCIDARSGANGATLAAQFADPPKHRLNRDGETVGTVPVNTVLKSDYITARAAARQMLRQGSGVIMFLTGSPARPHLAGVAAIGAANGVIENLTRYVAIELGPAGRRRVSDGRLLAVAASRARRVPHFRGRRRLHG